MAKLRMQITYANGSKKVSLDAIYIVYINVQSVEREKLLELLE